MNFGMFYEWSQLRAKVRLLQLASSEIEISDELVLMLIVGEDHRFFTHPGVDLLALFRSLWRMSRGLPVEGGSTIAMQLVRVLTGRYQRTIRRKLIEILFAIWVTKLIGKKDLPKMYMMIAYYGWQMNGLNQAAKRLGFNIRNASPYEAARLVARLKYPEPNKPNPWKVEQINNRVSHILNNRIKYERVVASKWKHLTSQASY
jgi:penicillin-binding protein 1A